MKEKLKSVLLAIAAFVLLAAGTAAAAVLIWESGGRGRPFSSHSTLPQGCKAFYLLLEESGHPVQRWDYPLTMLPADGAGEVLFIVEPGRRPPLPAEARALRDWVGQGNRLVLLGMEQSALYEAFDLELEATHRSSKPLRIEPDSSHAFLEGVSRLEFRTGATFAAGSGGVLLAGDDKNSFILFKAAGEGEVIVITDAGMITNEALRRGDNFIFLLNTAGAFSGPLDVLIDEYHHGFGRERPARSPSAGRGFAGCLTWPALQLALFTLLLLITLGRRFAAPRPLPEPSPHALSHTIAAAAAIYRKAGARKAPFAYLYAGLKRRLIRKYRLGHDPGPAEIARLGERAAGLNRQELEREFGRFEAVSGGEKITAAELLEMSRRLDRYREEFNV